MKNARQREKRWNIGGKRGETALVEERNTSKDVRRKAKTMMRMEAGFKKPFAHQIREGVEIRSIKGDTRW